MNPLRTVLTTSTRYGASLCMYGAGWTGVLVLMAIVPPTGLGQTFPPAPRDDSLRRQEDSEDTPTRFDCSRDFVRTNVMIELPPGMERLPRAVPGAQGPGLTIVVNAGPTLAANAPALAAFQRAADTWENWLNDPVTVVIDVDFGPQDPGVLGRAVTRVQIQNYNTVRNAMVADADPSSEGLVLQLPTLSQYSLIVPPGFTATTNLAGTKANLRALGFDMSFDDAFPDATITFSIDFLAQFDFDASDGIGAGLFDFEAVALHELGHSLGFSSGLNLVDLFVAAGQTTSVFIFTHDMFRLRPGDGAADFSNRPRIGAPGSVEPVQRFYDGAVDLGLTTGAFAGDGYEPSHWRPDEITGVYLGIMDATSNGGVHSVETANDIRALGLIGWDVEGDCNGNGVPDSLDIAMATSTDCDTNGVPDECQPDSDGDTVIDACDGCPNDPLLTAPGLCGCADAPTNCDDANACTTDTCDAGLGCLHVGTGITVACDDGNACTTSDVCQGDAAGTCAGIETVVCTALDQCHVPGTCNPTTGVCDDPNAMDGTTCNDSNACTQSDVCQSGVCTGSNPVVCTASDQCHVAGTCDPTTGVCDNPLATDGTACDDTDACTQTDTCQTGICTGSNPVVCTALDQCHVAGTCDSATGVCDNPNAMDGTTCDDGDACTQTDACQTGTCTGANPIVCTASDQCHVPGTCNPATGVCDNPNATDGTPCDDSDLCSQTDTCQTGVCTGSNPVVCTASDQCHVPGTCDTTTGVCNDPTASDGTACDDADACTQTDICQSGICTGSNPVVCSALDQCHVAGTCIPATGLCDSPNAADGTSCDDGDACTQADACQIGVCTGANPIVCVASDQCHAAGTCNPASGICDDPIAMDGTTCDDSDACTQSDACQSGVCTGTNPVVCTALDQCHVAGTCDSATGLCDDPIAPDGTACDDSDACTQTDACQSGVCTGTNLVVCTALDQCHVAGTCDSVTGLCDNPNAADGTTCDDGDACTQAASCQAGVCAGGDPIVCAASDECHVAGICDPATGLCDDPNAADGTICDNGLGECIDGFCAPLGGIPTVSQWGLVTMVLLLLIAGTSIFARRRVDAA